MISKGKARVLLYIVDDQHQLVLGFNIIWVGVDAEAIKPLVDQVMEKSPTLDALITDKGYWSPEVNSYLFSNLEIAAIPKKGRLYKEKKERQGSAAFVHARNQHPGIESAINALQHRVLSYGSEGFARTVGASAITANLMRLGSVPVKKQVKADKD